MSGIAVGLDYAAIMAVAAAQGADGELLSEALPEVEVAIVAALNGDAEGDE